MPILIAHRGNLYGQNPSRENDPAYLVAALNLGFQVETDVWYIDNGTGMVGWWLGHDMPQYFLDDAMAEELLTDIRVWCHCKNYSALAALRVLKAHCFWHQEDDYTITSEGVIWAYPGKCVASHGLFEPMVVAVMPERCPDSEHTSLESLRECYGVCTDEVYRYQELLS